MRRSKDDWAALALAALAAGGPAAVAIEPLAAAAGVTKGSVYWHFPNRDALLAAALRRWETEHTDAVIELVEREGDPKSRLVALFTSVLVAPGPQVELALVTAADDPVVSAAVRRVTDRRLGYLTDLFALLGCPAGPARDRALLAYSIYLGHAQLAVSAPGVLPSGRAALQSYVDESLRVLMP